MVTTGCKHDIPVATNLLMRNFTAPATNQVCRGDIDVPPVSVAQGFGVQGLI